jgi:hypothetical protein
MLVHRFALAFALTAGVTVSLLTAAPSARQNPQTPDQRVAALKKNLADGQAALRKYEWVETTVLSLKGEEKSRKQMRCYYGADGKLQKTALDAAPAPAPAPAPSGGRGGRVKGKVVANKKDEMKDYMEKAAALIHKYVPPAPEKIQKVKDAKKLAVTPVDPSKVRLELSDYLQSGDKLTITVNAATNTLAGLSVATYLDKPADTVTLDVQFGALSDGTSYQAQTTFVAAAKNIQVVIQNSGHRPLQPTR